MNSKLYVVCIVCVRDSQTFMRFAPLKIFHKFHRHPSRTNAKRFDLTVNFECTFLNVIYYSLCCSLHLIYRTLQAWISCTDVIASVNTTYRGQSFVRNGRPKVILQVHHRTVICSNGCHCSKSSLEQCRMLRKEVEQNVKKFSAEVRNSSPPPNVHPKFYVLLSWKLNLWVKGIELLKYVTQIC